VTFRLLPPLGALCIIAGCGLPEARLRAGLVNAGVPPPLAGCMAGRMTARLSIAQLRRIGELPRARAAPSAAEFLHRVRALGDPEIVSVSAAAAAACEARRLLG
jgi:hypothetical protein